MFGLTEEEMNFYRDITQDYAVETVAPKVKKQSIFIVDFVQQGDNAVPDMLQLRQLLTDLETIITLTATNMAYEYAHLQCETDLSEEEIVEYLHKKYEDYVFRQCLKYGVCPTADCMDEIVLSTMLELPYLYAEAIDDEDFDEDEFLEERLAAYTKYLDENVHDDEEDMEED